MSQAPVTRDQMLSKIVAGGPAARPPAPALDPRGGGSLVALAAAALLLFGRSDGSRQRRTVRNRGGDARRRSPSRCRPPATCSRPTRSTSAARSRASSRRCFVDDNDRVKTGQVLARLDVSKLEDQRRQRAAALASAEARVLQAAASVKEANANLSRLRQVVGAVRRQGAVEGRAGDGRGDRGARRRRRGQRARRGRAGARLAQLGRDEPREGVDPLADRRRRARRAQIEPGQTVAASFQAPTLFTLAEDLGGDGAQVDVDEADVGQVRDGQAATFSVDAYPGRKYPARITARGLRLADEGRRRLLQDGPERRQRRPELRPGMTATAEITTVERSDALLVPNAALRFSPRAAAASRRTGAEASSGACCRGRRERSARNASATATVKPGTGQVWVLRERRARGSRRSRSVTTDGRLTEVSATGREGG